MSGNYGLYFNAATGTWDVKSNWQAEGYYNGNQAQVPDSGSPIYLLSTVQDLHANGAKDQASSIIATGSSASLNTLDIGGTLNVGGMASFTGFDVIVEHGGSFTEAQLALSNSTMEVYGYASLSNGGGATLHNATLVVESGGTMVAQEINGLSTDVLIVDGTLHLTGGGPGVGLSNTIGAGGLVVMDGYEGTDSSWSIQGGTFASSITYQNGTFNFSGTGGVLYLPNDSTNNSNITVTGFSAGDAIIFGSATGTGAITTTIVNGNTLELIQGGTIVGEIDHFTLAPGTELSSIHGRVLNGKYVVNYCFFPGTRLAGEHGEIAVEDIAIGTKLRTATGEVLPVRWVGWSDISTRFADPLRALPIRIKANALADGVPSRDLLVSPDHALFLGGVLVQAGALVNCTSILREENVPENFRYYHVELATHELLLAENCPAESFVDNVDRMNFHNWDAREAPAEPVLEMDYARVKSARQLPAALRQTLVARAAALASPHAA